MSAKVNSFEKDGKKFPTLELRREGSKNEFGFTFGVSKAKLILAHIEDIKDFVQQNGGD